MKVAKAVDLLPLIDKTLFSLKLTRFEFGTLKIYSKILTKFTFSKCEFSQNSQFQSVNSHFHIFKVCIFTKFTF